jgi:hypothetical protein
MNGERPADEPHRGGSGAEAIERRLARRHDLGLLGETQIVVGRQNDDVAAAFHPDHRTLGSVEMVQALVHAIPAELLELRLQPPL